jgi:hypothetical protein
MIEFTGRAGAFAVAACLTLVPVIGRAEPLVTQGVGTSNCARIANDIKPADGLANPVNLILYAWVQGYVSAANIALLEDGSKHVDMSAFDDAKVLYQVQAFCKANPDLTPVGAVDEMIRSAPKVPAKWEPGTVGWEQ